MKITGKCREDFEIFVLKYFRQERKDYDKFTDSTILGKFYRMTDVFKNALIIEWFDSVGIHVFVILDFGWNYELAIKGKILDSEIDDYFNNRLEATSKAIEKANEICNTPIAY